MGVSDRFTTFLQNISLTEAQKTTGAERRDAVVKALNKHYYNSSRTTDNSRYIGSWGKYTRIRPPRDVDVLFTLPKSVYDRFQQRAGNKQSQLLQEVKDVLLGTFYSTVIKGDGPAVVIPFTAYDVELVPAFKLVEGGYWICMTNNGGYYKKADYEAEATHISTSNTKTNNNTRHLVKMMKRWQAYCDVPLKSFWIELISVSFLNQWQYAGKTAVYYDYIVRDFLSYLGTQTWMSVYAPGTGEAMNLGNAWESKAKTALGRAQKACELETSDAEKAGEEWQKIFGPDIPKKA